MNEFQLKQIYPEGKLTKSRCNREGWLDIPLKDKFFSIPEEKLSISEKKLLQLILTVEEKKSCKNHWYQIIFEKVSPPEGQFRMLQMKLDYPTDFQITEWIKAVKLAFLQSVDFFAVDEKNYILIEKIATENYSKKVIEGIFLSLDNDFSITSTVYIGQVYGKKETLTSALLEELDLFKKILQTENTSKRVFSFSDIALPYYTQANFQNSPLTKEIQRRLKFDSEMKKIIMVLWKNRGNISLSAKKLYLHRNTLQYRLDKFYVATDLNLKEIDDLLFVYLFLINEGTEIIIEQNSIHQSR